MKLRYTLTWDGPDGPTLKYRQDFDTLAQARKEMMIHKSRNPKITITQIYEEPS